MSADKYGLKIEEYFNSKDIPVYRVYRLYDSGKRKERDINYGFFLDKADAENAFHIINEAETQPLFLFSSNSRTRNGYGTLNTTAEAGRHFAIVDLLLQNHNKAIKAKSVDATRKQSLYKGIQGSRTRKRQRQQIAKILMELGGGNCDSVRRPSGQAQHNGSTSILPSSSGQTQHKTSVSASYSPLFVSAYSYKHPSAAVSEQKQHKGSKSASYSPLDISKCDYKRTRFH